MYGFSFILVITMLTFDINKLSQKDREKILTWRQLGIGCGNCEFLEPNLTCPLTALQCPKMTIYKITENGLKEQRETIKEKSGSKNNGKNNCS
jgi:hypothetical protein